VQVAVTVLGTENDSTLFHDDVTKTEDDVIRKDTNNLPEHKDRLTLHEDQIKTGRDKPDPIPVSDSDNAKSSLKRHRPVNDNTTSKASFYSNTFLDSKTDSFKSTASWTPVRNNVSSSVDKDTVSPYHGFPYDTDEVLNTLINLGPQPSPESNMFQLAEAGRHAPADSDTPILRTGHLAASDILTEVDPFVDRQRFTRSGKGNNTVNNSNNSSSGGTVVSVNNDCNGNKDNNDSINSCNTGSRNSNGSSNTNLSNSLNNSNSNSSSSSSSSNVSSSKSNSKESPKEERLVVSTVGSKKRQKNPGMKK
jgi:hypothetical protein